MVVSPATVEDQVETVVLAYPDLRPLRIRVLEWQVSQGAILSAEAYARRALASDDADDETRLRLAMLLVRSSGVEEGTEHVRRYLESQGDNGKAWMLLGEALAMQQQMAEADMAIERAMQLDSSPIVLRQAMMHYMNSGRRERANAIMERLKLPRQP
jgi:Flp pilus assembly protein TadD